MSAARRLPSRRTRAAPPSGGSCGTVTLDGTSKTVGGGEANWVITVTAPDAHLHLDRDLRRELAGREEHDADRDAGCRLGHGEGAGGHQHTGVARTGHVTINGVVYTVKQLVG